MNFVDKYKPKSTKDILGQDIGLNQLRLNLKKPVFIYGPPGTGKTATIHALANDMNYEIIELNASDFRNKDEIDSIVGNSIKQKSLFNKGKIILVDELDGISGKEDRGGVQALLVLIQESTFPVIMVANDPWNSRFSQLRMKSKMIDFKKLNYLTIFNILTKICKSENIKISDKDLRELSIKSDGDVRAAINDLEIVSYNNNLEGIGERERETSIFNAIQLILKSNNPKEVLNILDRVNMDLNDCILWLEENIALEYKNKHDLARAYDILSKADVYRGRITKWQHWRFLVYIYDLISAGIAVSKKNKYYGFTKYRKPARILEIWKFNQKNKLKKDISIKIAKKVHTSIKHVKKDFLFYKRFINKDIIKELNLSEEEAEFLKN
ncbi:MAG: replication factor C large subunit [Nanoarchaeota archaeon]|nr:replication factor C large subunit [Nanoarchaeota archaeon]MBU0962812.1 replication factor C large subunit [Nanoarchaeota archaeon]